MESAEIRRARRANHAALIICTALAVCIPVFVLLQHVRHSFTPEKWRGAPDARVNIVDNLLLEHPLVGMPQTELFTLLGTPDGSFAEGNGCAAYYYLGPERGLISIDSEWLVLRLENGFVQNVSITTD